MLAEGGRYYFRAVGMWRDAWVPCDVNGYDKNYLNPVKRYLRCTEPDARWFTLIGAVEASSASLFVIGDGARWPEGWVAPMDGQLTAFANDIAGFYWNNFHSITLEVWQ